MTVRKMPMLILMGVALMTATARAEDDGQAAASTPTPAPGALGLLEQGADEEAIEFSKELRTVEEEVGDLKERVFRSKATLKLLKELVIDSAAAGARLAVWHVNQLGGAYTMESVQYYLDGKNIYSRVDPEGGLDGARSFVVHEQTIAPGSHDLQVHMVLRGKGYRLFSYLRSYRFKVQSSYTLDVEEGSQSVLRVITESRGALKSFEERPAIRYDARIENLREE